ncbi:hypothetical protein FPSE5266_12212 [Fusarium pseudograminearum]|nr:hypothetical protein FPSE5266_12212 [Fusarium pseudograminearum]
MSNSMHPFSVAADSTGEYRYTLPGAIQQWADTLPQPGEEQDDNNPVEPDFGRQASRRSQPGAPMESNFAREAMRRSQLGAPRESFGRQASRRSQPGAPRESFAREAMRRSQLGVLPQQHLPPQQYEQYFESPRHRRSPSPSPSPTRGRMRHREGEHHGQDHHQFDAPPQYDMGAPEGHMPQGLQMAPPGYQMAPLGLQMPPPGYGMDSPGLFQAPQGFGQAPPGSFMPERRSRRHR